MRTVWLHVITALILLAPVPVGFTYNAALAQAETRVLVPVEVFSDGGYARLVFKWQDISSGGAVSGHTASIENGVLVVRFDQAFQVDLDLLREKTEDFIALVRQDGDGHTLRMALKYPFELQSGSDEADVAVDLIPQSFNGTPPAYKAPRPAIDMESLVITGTKRDVPTLAELRRLEIAPKPLPLDAPRLPVRVIRNDTRSRIIFQWPEKVGYDVIREGDQIVVNFNQVARPTLARLRIDPPPYVKTAEAVQRFGGLEVRIDVDPAADFHHFREEGNIILDLVPRQNKELDDALAAVDQEDKAEHLAQSETSETSETSGHAPDHEPKPEHISDAEHAKVPDHEPDTDPALASPSQHASVSEEHVQDPEPDHEPDHQVAGHESDKPVEAIDDGQHETPAEHKSAPVHGEPAHGEPAHNEPEHAAPTGHATPAEHATGEILSGDKVVVELIDTAEGVEVNFPWGKDVAAAVFRRGDFLWAVFDATNDIDLTEFDRGSHYEVSEMDDFSTDDMTFVRLGLGPRALVTVRPEHHGWRIQLGETAYGDTKNITLVPDVKDRGQARIYSDIPSANTVHRIVDPEVGDEIIVVTALGPAQGLISARKYIDFLALSSAHGLAIQPISEGLDVSIHDGIVSITRFGGLSVTGASSAPALAAMDPGLSSRSASNDHKAGGSQTSFEGDSAPGVMDFVGWRGDEAAGFFGNIEQLSDALRKAPRRERSERRLALARFHFSHGLLAEAVGILSVIESEDPAFANVGAYVALKGATEHLMFRHEQALETLSHFSVREDAGASIWRGMALEALGFHKRARDELAKGMNAGDNYPSEWQARFLLAEANAALGVNDLEDANSMWENIPLGALDDEKKAEAFVTKGKILKAIGEPALALEYFRKVYPLTDGEMSHRARYEEIMMLYQVGEHDAETAIDRLDRLRFQWRGDDLELRAIQSLGDIYLDQHRYRDALTVLRAGFSFDPQHAISRDMRDTLGDVFEELYLDGKASKMKPAAAISLFYDFKELTPIGAKGDRMIRLLSERLVSIGLLDQAAELLMHQVKYRLKGTARSQVAMRLALIQLKNKRPEAAFQAISSTRFAGLPPKLGGQRRLIEARALADLGRHEHAIELLEDDISAEAQILRANIYWDADNWPETGRIYEQILESKWGNDKDLSNETRSGVMRMAIAYALVEDTAALERIRRKFGAQMAASPDAQAFNIATGDMALQGVAFRDVLRRVNSIDTFEAFMSDFKNRFGDDGTMVN